MIISSEAIAIARSFAAQRGIRLNLRDYDEFRPCEETANWGDSDWIEDLYRFDPSGAMVFAGAHYRPDGTCAGVVTYRG